MTTQPLSMARRLDFAAKARKPKDELWLGCVVSEVESFVSKMGYPYLKVKFSNCPYICMFGAHDGYALQRMGYEHGRKTRTPEAGDVLNLNVYWKLNPRDIQKRYKLGEYSPVPKLVLHDLLGEAYDIEPVEQIPVAIEAPPALSWLQGLQLQLKEYLCRL